MTFVKTFSFLFLFLALLSCGKGGGGGSSHDPANAVSAEITDSIEEAINTDTTPVEAMTFEVNAKLYGFSKTQKEKIYDAIEIIKKVVASDEFREKVINKKYNGKKRYVDNKGLTNRQIYTRILEASEKLTKYGRNNTMDIELQLYNDPDSLTVGYTYPTVIRVWMNRKYFSKYKANEVAGNMFHEWLHKIGFGHAVEANASRPHSVPYSIGYLIRDLGKQYL